VSIRITPVGITTDESIAKNLKQSFYIEELKSFTSDKKLLLVGVF
jgi:hypothetical protein